jgi:hypothetical protein
VLELGRKDDIVKDTPTILVAVSWQLYMEMVLFNRHKPSRCPGGNLMRRIGLHKLVAPIFEIPSRHAIQPFLAIFQSELSGLNTTKSSTVNLGQVTAPDASERVAEYRLSRISCL